MAVLAAGLIYTIWKARKPSLEAAQENGQKKGVIIRWNVLALLLVAYVSLVGIFVFMVMRGLGIQEAYDNVSVPLVALVGGTLAVVKDLL